MTHFKEKSLFSKAYNNYTFNRVFLHFILLSAGNSRKDHTHIYTPTG